MNKSLVRLQKEKRAGSTRPASASGMFVFKRTRDSLQAKIQGKGQVLQAPLYIGQKIFLVKMIFGKHAPECS